MHERDWIVFPLYLIGFAIVGITLPQLIMHLIFVWRNGGKAVDGS